MLTLVLVILVTLALSFLCSILEAVLLSVTSSYAAVLEEEGSLAGERLVSLLRNIDEPIATILTLNTVAHTAGAVVGGAIAQQLFGSGWVPIFSAGLTFAVLVLSEIIPKTIGQQHWQRLARPSAHTLHVMTVALSPVTKPLNMIARVFAPCGQRSQTISRAELEALAEIGHSEGTIDGDELRVIGNIIRLDEVNVAEIMTPRIDIAALREDASVDDAVDLMLKYGHFRVPVYRRSLDNIVGIVVARDLWRAQREGITDIRSIIRSVPFVPESKKVEVLIPEMRQERTNMAIVLDEFGGTAGLVTLEDLIEQIVGDIQDEHEGDEPAPFVELPAGRIRVWGGTPVRLANERLDLEIDDDQYDTVGGFVFGEIGTVPTVGSQLEVSNGRLMVTRLRKRRIEFLTFVPNTNGPIESEGDQ